MHRPWIVPWFATVCLAQQPDLPELRIAGAMPDGAVHVNVAADGSLTWVDDRAFGMADFAVALVTISKNQRPLVLKIDGAARAAIAGELLTACIAASLPSVLLAASLPDRSIGCLTLALPAGDVETGCTVRLHRERAGVPIASLVPILRRMLGRAGGPRHAIGHEGMHSSPPTVGIECPGDASFAVLLATLAAVADAGAVAAAVHCTAPAGANDAAEPNAELAVDLGPSPLVQVPARDSLIGPVPVHRLPVFGFAQRPALKGTAAPAGGRVGGLYGGRTGTKKEELPRLVAAMEAGLLWLTKQQAASGCWTDDAGRANVEATALAVLALLANGKFQVDGVRRGTGWLLAQQANHGSFCAPGSGSVRPHALATYALAEASSLSPGGGLLRGAVSDALAWLMAQQGGDGAWHDGTPGAADDTLSTTWCTVAFTSARFHGYPGMPDNADLLRWFDRVAEKNGAHRLHAVPLPSDASLLTTSTGGSLFSRMFLGQSPQTDATMAATVELLLASHEGYDPLATYWITFALFQVGGEPWAEWAPRTSDEILGALQTVGEHADSWNPAPGSSRVAATSLRVLTLTSYRRYSRLR